MGFVSLPRLWYDQCTGPPVASIDFRYESFMESQNRSAQVSGPPAPLDKSREEPFPSLAPPPSAEPSTRLLLICHAESMRQGAFTVDDPGLSALGWDQASALATWLHTYEQIDMLVTSRQLRCRLTAQRIGQQVDVQPTLSIDFPSGVEDRWALYPPAPGRRGAEDAYSQYVQYQTALMRALDRIVREGGGKTIAVILDAVGAATILRTISQSPDLGIHIDPSSVSEIYMKEGRWFLAYVNRREHLPRPSTPTSANNERSRAEADAVQEIEVIRQVYNQAAMALPEPESGSGDEGDMVSGADLWRFATLEPDVRILEIGAGSGRLAMELAQAGAREVIGVDVSPAMLERAERRRLSQEDRGLARRVSFRLAASFGLPFAAGRFDVVICCQILHHLSHPESTLAECHRVLRPDGLLIVVDLAGPEDPVKRATQNAIEAKRNPSHASVRTVQQLSTLLTKTQFRVEKEEVRTATCSAHQWLARLNLDTNVQARVMEMLEASIETDAAGLHVRRIDDDLVFDEAIALLVARKVEVTRPSGTTPVG